ncbi:MAG: aldo/keto reductase [Candidatus Aenigmarchaeota archaeon]|nr:aldo/keto reductase [Candidatus Aenigmarchaeota archaeon]
MEFKPLAGDTKIPVIGLGTWEVGGEFEKDEKNDARDISAIKKAIEMGYTHIDTAEMYAAGHSEELVGQAIEGVERSRLFITTKVSPDNLRYEDVLESARSSMRRMGIDYIDLYLIHAPNPKIPIQETMRAMDELFKEKMIRFIGVSNFSAEQLKEAQECTDNKIVANQIEYNLLVRDKGLFNRKIEKEIIPYCQDNDVVVIAYRPVCQGKLTKAGHEILDRIARKYDKTQAQVAINWLISKKGIVTIPKSSNPKHLKENLEATGWSMDNEDIEELDNLTS